MKGWWIMKVYVLSGPGNFSFAKRLFSDVKQAEIVTGSYAEDDTSVTVPSVGQSMEKADVILALIDEDFLKSRYLEQELQLAQILVHKNQNKLLLPVILKAASAPEYLEESRCIFCDPESGAEVLRTQWLIEEMLAKRRSGRRKRKPVQSRNLASIILTLAIEALVIFLGVLLFKYLPDHRNTGVIDEIGLPDGTALPVLLGVIAGGISLVPLVINYLSIMKKRWREDEEEEIESYSRRLKKAIVPAEPGQGRREAPGDKEKKAEIDALGRMLINLEDIKAFYTWSQKQAKASFVLAVTMCVAGFVLMMIAVLLPVIFRLDFQTSIIPASGGVITELIAGTALVVYRNSLEQLNHYHKALHEDERFLSSVNLLGTFSTTEARDEMLREIIRSEIQMNLESLGENRSRKPDKGKEKEID